MTGVDDNVTYPGFISAVRRPVLHTVPVLPANEKPGDEPAIPLKGRNGAVCGMFMIDGENKRQYLLAAICR